MANQPGAGDPLTPVSLDDQKRAMELLADSVFAPEAFEALQRSADHLLAQRRGFDHANTTEDPKLHAVVLNIQRDILARLTDTRTYGNEYTVADSHGRNLESRAHREHVLYRIERSLDPPGA